MIEFIQFITAVLILILIAGIYRVIKGPTPEDRMLAAQLFGTAGVSIFILLATIESQPALINAALILALLAPISLISFVKLIRRN